MRYLVVCAALVFATLASAAKIASIDFDDPIEGKISGIDASERLLVTPDGKKTEIGVNLDGIREIDFQKPVKLPSKEDARFRFVFQDGSILYGDIQEQKDLEALDWLKLKTLTKGELKLRYDGLQRAERREDAEPGKDQYFSKQELKDVKPGLNWRLFKADGSSNFACGEPALYPNKVEYLLDLERDEVAMVWSEIRTLVRKARDDEPFDKLYGLFSTRKGERFVGRVQAWKDGEVKLLTRYFDTITLKEDNLATAIFRNGRFTFLSDMPIDKVEEYPYLRTKEFKASEHLFPYKIDRAQGGGAINLRGKTYAKGIGVHAISKLTFDLKKRYGRFLATVGVDNSAGDRASVVFRVFVDGKEVKFKQTPIEGKDGEAAKTVEKLSSGVMRKSTTPLNIEVDVAGAESLKIVVEAADNADVHDRANWANAMLVR